MNRIQEAKRWIASIPVEQLAETVKEAKLKYKTQVPQKRLEQIRSSRLPQEQKLILEARLFLIQMYLEEHPEEQ